MANHLTLSLALIFAALTLAVLIVGLIMGGI